MAQLMVPEACASCGLALEEGQRIVFERRARLQRVSSIFWPGNSRLEPMVEARPIRNVRHLECAGG